MALIEGNLCDICEKFFPRDKLSEAEEHAKIPLSIPYPVGLLLKGENKTSFTKEGLYLILVHSIHSYDERHVARYDLESFVPSKEYNPEFNMLLHGDIPCSASGFEIFLNQQWSLLTEDELVLHKPYIIQELQGRNEEREKFGGKAMPIPEVVITYEKKNEILVPAGK